MAGRGCARQPPMIASDHDPAVASSELQKLWALSFERTTRGIAIIEPGTRSLVAVNPAFAAMHGGAVKDFVGKPIDSSLTPEGVRRLPELVGRLDQSGFIALESDHVRLDGTVFRVATEVMAAHAADGSLLYRMCWFTDLTKQRRLERQTREAERQFEIAFTRAAVGMGLVGLDGRWKRANPALCQITGYEESELRELTFSEITHPDDLVANIEGDELLLRGRAEDYRLETRYVRKDGEAVWVGLAVSLARDDDGDPIHYIVHAQDISLRKRMEKDLSRATVGSELSRDLMCTLGFDGHLDRLDGNWPEVLGWSEEELRSRPLFDFIHPGDRPQALIEIADLAAGAGWRSFRNRWKTKGGSWSWLVWSAVAVVAEQRIFCAVREADDQIANERALELRGEVIANMADGVCLVTIADRLIVYANPSLERMLGYEPGELRGRDVVGVMRPCDLSDVEERERSVAESTLLELGGSSYEGRRMRKDGSGIWCHTTTTTFDHPRYGEIWVVVQEDVTAKRHAREAAAELERAKREFLGSISHELRTPLTSILGYTALLRADADGSAPPRRDHIDVIERNATRQLRLVEDLLSIARIEAGEFEIRRRPLDLERLIDGEVEALRPDAEAAGLTLGFVSGGALEVNGDGDRLGQVLTNLISNSIKFTPSGGRIEVGLQRRDGEALITVADDGPGIAAPDGPRLFERLYRGEDVKGRQIPGAGLGLAISRSIVEAHAGHIEVGRARVGGATLEVTLPSSAGP
jgi:PAS domain S-box-containing protein